MHKNSYQEVTIVGDLAKDPEKRFTSNGTAVTNFVIPTNYRYKVGDELREETTWFKVVAFGPLAESCAELKKRSQVLVKGRMQPEIRVWEDKNGNHRASYELRADYVTFLNKPPQETNSVSEDDIPF